MVATLPQVSVAFSVKGNAPFVCGLPVMECEPSGLFPIIKPFGSDPLMIEKLTFAEKGVMQKLTVVRGCE